MPPGQMQRAESKFIVFEQFAKLNTQSVRQALKEGELAWLENLQPIAPNNLLAVPGPARSALVTLLETASVMFYANLNNVDYLVVFSTAGAGYAINIATAVISQFAPDGTFSQSPDVTTWQASRLLIADPIAGYGTYDGTLYINTGNVSPNITVTNGGSGYSQSSPPSVTITGGSGSGATAHAVVGPNGSVVQVVLDNPGHGYLPTDVLTVTFGTSPGSGATAHVTMTGFPIASITSNGFSPVPPLTPGNYALAFSGGGGSGTEAYYSTSSNAVTVTSPGVGYTSAPTVTIPGHTGGSFKLTAVLGTESVASIVLTAGGTGYLAPPAVTITPADGNGSGAAAVTTLSGTSVNTIALVGSPVDSLKISNQGNFTTVPGTYALVFTGGGGSLAAGTATLTSITDPVTGNPRTVISAVNITNNGSGYTTAPTVSISGATGSNLGIITAHITSQGLGYDATPTVFIGAGSGAAASAHIWPFTVSSNPLYAYTTLAVFQGRVWLGGGPLLTWTGTGASSGNVGYDDFNIADASGSLIITDADLIHAITALRAANNYLYIMGDQSVKQIGNISVSSGITLFTILTLSSDQGTIYSRSCGSFNRVFMFANSNGIYAVFGSSVQKISDDLDGLFRLIDFSQGPQAALADMNNIHNIAFLVRYKDPLASTRSLFLIFNGQKWFFASQGNNLKTIATSASLATGTATLYGSSGTDITALFNDSTVPVAFKWQSALSHHGNAIQRKKIIRAGFAVTMGATGPLNMSVDSDEGSNNYSFNIQQGFRALSFQTDDMARSIDGAGRYLGMTITGTLANFVGSAMTLEYQETNVGNRNTP